MSLASDEDSGSIPRFPEEITEKILSFCDGSTLLNAKLASKTCRDIIDKRIKWEVQCRNEIPPRLLDELLTEMHPKHWVIKDKIGWKNIYETWSAWNSFQPGRVEKLSEPPTAVNCVEISGDVAFIGHQKGVLSVHLVSNETCTIYYGPSVETLDLFCSRDAPPRNKTIKGCLHDNLDLYLRPRFHHSVNLHKKYHHSRVYPVEREQIITKYYKNSVLHFKCNHKNPEFELFIDGIRQELVDNLDIKGTVGFCLWESTIGDSSISSFVKNLCVEALNSNLDVFVSGSDKSSNSSKNVDCHCGCLSDTAYKLKYWKHGVFFAVTMCNRLYVSWKNKDMLYSSQHFVTAVELFQNILFLGTDVGYVFLHRVQDLDELLFLDMDKINGVDVDDCPIKLIRCYQSNCTPGLVIATANAIYRVRMDV